MRNFINRFWNVDYLASTQENEAWVICLCTLRRTDERLAKVKTKLLQERKQNRTSQYSTIDTRSVLESTCQRDLSNRFFIPRSFSGENVMVPTSNLWHSIETTENCKTKVVLSLLSFRFHFWCSSFSFQIILSYLVGLCILSEHYDISSWKKKTEIRSFPEVQNLLFTSSTHLLTWVFRCN